MYRQYDRQRFHTLQSLDKVTREHAIGIYGRVIEEPAGGLEIGWRQRVRKRTVRTTCRLRGQPDQTLGQARIA
ncbi:hypothetical protein IMCC9480_582 [Oxalobacteraceae bacterium IMCC9480]|nr:hypothetical protein IMCC9480_582 [Oxalobacteraceae bacterium IMCC9480]